MDAAVIEVSTQQTQEPIVPVEQVLQDLVLCAGLVETEDGAHVVAPEVWESIERRRKRTPRFVRRHNKIVRRGDEDVQPDGQTPKRLLSGHARRAEDWAETVLKLQKSRESGDLSEERDGGFPEEEFVDEVATD